MQISSNVILVDGNSNPSPPEYINNDSVYLVDSSSWVSWSQGYEIPTNFTVKIFMSPAQINTILRLGNQTIPNGSLTVKFNREIPYGGTTVKDYFVLKCVLSSGSDTAVLLGFLNTVSTHCPLY